MAEVYQDRLFAVDKQCKTCGETKPVQSFYFSNKARGILMPYCKECTKRRATEWSRAHPQRRKQTRDRYKEAAAERRLHLAVTVDNKRCVLCGVIKKCSGFYSNAGTPDGLSPRCKDCSNEQMAEYRRKNAAEISARKVQDQRDRPENPRARSRRRRARKYAADGDITASEWQAKLKLYEGLCHWCEQMIDGTPHMDHVMPLVLGGAHKIENVVPACSTCNYRKGVKHPAVWRAQLRREKFGEQ